MLMNAVKHAVLDAVRLFLDAVRLFLVVVTPWTVPWHHGKGLLGAWAPPSRCYTESHHRHYQELARLRHARAAGLVPDNRELVDNRVDTLDFNENQYQELVSIVETRCQYQELMSIPGARERQAQYWNHEMVNEA